MSSLKCLFAILVLSMGGFLWGGSPSLNDDGRLDIDGIKLDLTTFTANWRTLTARTNSECFELQGSESGKRLTYRTHFPDASTGMLVLSFAPQEHGGELVGDAKFDQPSLVHSLCLSSSLPISVYQGVSFEVDGQPYQFPEEFGKEELVSRRVKRFRLPSRNGEILLEGDFTLRLQDNRKWNSGTFGLRLGFLPQTKQKIDQAKINFKIRCGSSGAFGASLGSVSRPEYIAMPGKDWKPFTYHRNVEKGSALDFSARLDAPAGKYGPVVTDAQGRFVFRDRPEIPARFYGPNIVGDANAQDQQQAEEFAERMASFGFNVIRIHHHDNVIYNHASKDSPQFDLEKQDKLEYLIACLKKQGIYYTTDIYVSRRDIPASEIPELGGIATLADYKAFFFVSDAVYANWEKWAKLFLERVNPYTGLALKDDPALITLSLLNEDNPASWWDKSPRAAKLYKEKFQVWKGEHPQGNFPEFLSDLAISRYRQMEKFLRSLGCKTLLTDQNFISNLDLAPARSNYDFVDNHAYWDHPRFLEKKWQLPVQPSQSNPLSARPGVPGKLFASRFLGKGYTISEFDYANPNIYRACGPALIAAYAAFQDWDGLFPFAYAHSRSAAFNPDFTRGYFDIGTDPIKTFAQRIGATVFLAGGIKPADRLFAAIASTPFGKYSGATAPDEFSDLGFLAKIGITTDPTTATKVDAWINLGAGNAPSGKTPVFQHSKKLLHELVVAGLLPNGCIDASGKRFTAPGGQLVLDRAKKTFQVSAPGAEVLVLGPQQRLSGKTLCVNNRDSFAVFALLPVDSEQLDQARRLLLMHLTNTQATGMKFGSDRLERLDDWGRTPFLAKHNTAEVALNLPSGSWEVYAIDTAGKRIAPVPVSNQAGILQLAIDNFLYPEVVFAYELLRK